MVGCAESESSERVVYLDREVMCVCNNYWVLCVRTACRRQLAAELLAAVAAEDYAAAADIRARMRQVPRPVPHAHTHIQAHPYASAQARMHRYTRARAQIHARAQMHARAHASAQRAHASAQRAHTRARTRKHTYTR